MTYCVSPSGKGILNPSVKYLPTFDYANVIYSYDSVSNTLGKLESGRFKMNGEASHLFSTSTSVYLDNKCSGVRLHSNQLAFLLKLPNKNVDPLTYLGFCTLKPFRKFRFYEFVKTHKFTTGYTFNNEITSWVIKKVADDVVLITPPAPLPPGEYSLFFFISGYIPRQSFAFGID